MCGRSCLTLDANQLTHACKYKKKKNNVKVQTDDDNVKESKCYEIPKYRNEYNLGLKLKSSHNTCPGEICPIIVSAKHFNDEVDNSDRVIIPALWGQIPRWHKGDYKKHGLTTNNARMETIRTSKLYKPSLDHGKRCIIPIEGFYEWQTVNEKLKSSERPAYFIYMPQNENVKIEDNKTWTPETVNLMYIAGVFDVWHDEDNDSIYSFSIITYESDDYFKWLHHRTPAILETEDQIEKWLNYEDFPLEEAFKVIKHPTKMIWHRVSNQVNNSRNKSDQCNKPKSQSEPKTILDFMKRKQSTTSESDDKIKQFKSS